MRVCLCILALAAISLHASTPPKSETVRGKLVVGSGEAPMVETAIPEAGNEQRKADDEQGYGARGERKGPTAARLTGGADGIGMEGGRDHCAGVRSVKISA